MKDILYYTKNWYKYKKGGSYGAILWVNLDFSINRQSLQDFCKKSSGGAPCL